MSCDTGRSPHPQTLTTAEHAHFFPNSQVLTVTAEGWIYNKMAMQRQVQSHFWDKFRRKFRAKFRGSLVHGSMLMTHDLRQCIPNTRHILGSARCCRLHTGIVKVLHRNGHA